MSLLNAMVPVGLTGSVPLASIPNDKQKKLEQIDYAGHIYVAAVIADHNGRKDIANDHNSNDDQTNALR